MIFSSIALAKFPDWGSIPDLILGVGIFMIIYSIGWNIFIICTMIVANNARKEIEKHRKPVSVSMKDYENV